MSNLKTIDIEDALRLDIMTVAEEGDFPFVVTAPPVPTDLNSLLPCAIVERLGGTRSDIVVDSHMVGVDVWANDWAEAQENANTILGLLSGLPFRDDLKHDYLGIDINAFPYNNPDPEHQDVPRVSFTAQVLVRAAQL